MLITTPTDMTPALFEELTEGRVDVSAMVSTDPQVDVGGRDDLRGFAGRVQDEVVRDGLRTVRVIVDAAGAVSGTFYKVDGVTPVAVGQVQLMDEGGLVGFDLTGPDGNFHFVGVRQGTFRLEGFDPSTARQARAEGYLAEDGQEAIVDLRLGPLGTVEGTVLDASGVQPVTAALVDLRISGAPTRQSSTELDGSFVFEAVPGGEFEVHAMTSEGLAGSAGGRIELEGETVSLDVRLEGSGSVVGTVYDAFGAPVPASDVTLIDAASRRRVTQAEPDGGNVGQFFFDNVPLGGFTIEARPANAITPGDGGRAGGFLQHADETVSVDVTFEGTIVVGVTVAGQMGTAPVVVSLESSGIFGGRAAPTSVVDGVYLFEGIPHAQLTASAVQQTPEGTTISASAVLGEPDLPPPGGRVVPDVELILNELGTVAGSVTDEAGTPLAGAFVIIVAGSWNSLAMSQIDGTFEFVGVPLDVDLGLEVKTGDGGRAFFTGTIDAAGVVRDQSGAQVDHIDLVVDATAPEVVGISPPSGAVNVPTNSTVVVSFSEPLEPGSVRTCPNSPGDNPTLRLLQSSGVLVEPKDPNDLCDDSNVIPSEVALSLDGMTATLTPAQPLVGASPAHCDCQPR